MNTNVRLFKRRNDLHFLLKDRAGILKTRIIVDPPTYPGQAAIQPNIYCGPFIPSFVLIIFIFVCTSLYTHNSVGSFSSIYIYIYSHLTTPGTHSTSNGTENRRPTTLTEWRRNSSPVKHDLSSLSVQQHTHICMQVYSSSAVISICEVSMRTRRSPHRVVFHDHLNHVILPLYPCRAPRA